MIKFDQLHAVIKFTAVYECFVCSKKETGSTKRLEVDCFSPTELKDYLEAQRAMPANMPVGWSATPNRFYCRDHK